MSHSENHYATQETDLLAVIIEGVREKKGKKIAHLDLSELENIPCKHFIICTAGSSPQVKAIATEIEKQTWEHLEEGPMRKEGVQHQEWIILDYFNIVVHIFLQEKRDFYKLEELWSDAKITHYEDLL